LDTSINTTDSINANHAEYMSQEARRMRRSETYRNTLIAILTFLFGLIGLLQLSGVDKNKLGPPSEILVFLADALLRHPVKIGLFAPAGMLLLLHVTGLYDIPNWRPLRTLLRIAQVIGQKTAALAAIASGIAIGFLTPDQEIALRDRSWERQELHLRLLVRERAGIMSPPKSPPCR
jgi:hypothetical protein